MFTKHFERISILGLLVLFVLSTFLQGCEMSKPKKDKPIPNIQEADKSFFLNSGSAKGFSLDGATPKNFACAWAAESSNGSSGSYMLSNSNLNFAPCNLQFRIFKDKIIGYQVNATRESDAWEPVISIGVNSHFYREAPKDGTGRDANRIENVQRSDWEARPRMALNFANIKIHKFFNPFQCPRGFPGSFAIDGVVESETEWDLENNFLGFTVKGSGTCGRMGSLSGTYRFNFLAFDHDSTFEPTPYHDSTAAHINLVGVTAKRHRGQSRKGLELFAMKWDVRGGKKHKIYINNFPAEYQQLGVEAVENWNDIFQEIFKDDPNEPQPVRPFVAVVEDLEHVIDLRKTAMNWVDDINEHNGNSPIGIANFIQDVRNGKAIWGGFSLWGDNLKNRANVFQATGGTSGSSATSLLTPNNSLFNDARLANLAHISGPLNIDAANQLQQAIDRTQQASFQRSQPAPSTTGASSNLTPEQIFELQSVLRHEILDGIEGVVGQLSIFQGHALNLVDSSRQAILDSSSAASGFLTEMTTEEAFKIGFGEHSLLQEGEQFSDLTHEQIIERVNDLAFSQYATSNSFDHDFTFDKLEVGWAQALDQGIPLEDFRESVIMFTLMHEMGHMLGLGHNHMENIVPVEGSVPQHIYKELHEQNNAEAGFTQMSTVMGYPSGMSQALVGKDHYKGGIMDHLVLRYLYRGQYPTYVFGDTASKDFNYKKVPGDGKIPPYVDPHFREEGVEYVSFLPACNDIYRFFGGNPYCRTFDRGGDAVSLMVNRFQELRGRVKRVAYAFSDQVFGVDHKTIEANLYYQAVTVFGQARTFYDYMRQKYDNLVIIPKIATGVKGKQNLLEFSRACRAAHEHPEYVTSDDDKEGQRDRKQYEETLSDAQKNETLKSAFAEYPELKELCVASGIFMHEIRNTLKHGGKDYTIIDYNNTYMTVGISGDSRWSDSGSKVLGQFLALGNWPLKYAAIQALTMTYPQTVFKSFILPTETYARQDGNFLTSTLYPFEFNRAVKSGVINNLDLGLNEEESFGGSQTINRTVAILGSMLAYQYMSNDIKKMPWLASNYFELIRKQSQFTLSVNPLFVTKVPEPSDEDFAKQLNAEVYNPFTRKSETLDWVFMTEDYKAIAKPQSQSFLYPVNNLTPYNADAAYLMTYKLSYTDDYADVMASSSVKSELYELYQEVLDACVSGAEGRANGLGQFFYTGSDAEKDFHPGFYWPDSTFNDERSRIRHRASIASSFQNYYEHKDAKPETCAQAVRSMGMIMNAAGLLNGLNLQVYDFVDFGSTQ